MGKETKVGTKSNSARRYVQPTIPPAHTHTHIVLRSHRCLVVLACDKRSAFVHILFKVLCCNIPLYGNYHVVDDADDAKAITLRSASLKLGILTPSASGD